MPKTEDDVVPQPRRGRPRDPERYRRVMEAARGHFDAHGFERASVDAIAAEAGVSKMTIYSHFASKEGLFEAVVRYAAERFAGQPDFGAWLHEAHHVMKKDAPSGTALLLERAMRSGGYDRPIDVSSTRAGHIPGTHTIGFDGPSDSITLTHTARDRAALSFVSSTSCV